MTEKSKDKDAQAKKPDTKDKDSQKSKVNAKPEKEDNEKDNHIGTTVDVNIRGINGDNMIRAKVDTGAHTCSIDARNLVVNTDSVTGDSTVKFDFNEYSYNMSVDGFQAVSSADGGTSNRPFVRFNVYINHKYIPDIIFNLNDRSNMDHPILIGMNLIDAGKFVIDPSVNEMDVSFGGPEGMVADTSVDPVIPDVDNSVESIDNKESIDLTQLQTALMTFLQDRLEMPLLQVINELTGILGKVNDATNTGETTE